jgi:hypothetical protein
MRKNEGRKKKRRKEGRKKERKNKRWRGRRSLWWFGDGESFQQALEKAVEGFKIQRGEGVRQDTLTQKHLGLPQTVLRQPGARSTTCEGP